MDTKSNLAVCPPEILAVDPNAETLWRILLRKVGIIIKGEHIEDKRAWILRNFGVPSLAQRLRPGMTERESARVWWRECAACSEGDAIPDLTADSLHNLNPWIVTPAEKYPDPRAARLEKARQAKQAESSESKTLRKTPIERNGKPVEPRPHRQPAVKEMSAG